MAGEHTPGGSILRAMHYEVHARPAALRHDPFKALAVPRPIGWVATLDAQGRPNLAPYSFFNAIGDRPPLVMFSSGGRKDSLRNVEATGEFTCSLATYDLRDAMNMSSAPVAAGVDEFALAGLAPAPSLRVKPPRVAASPAAFECRLWKTLDLPGPPEQPEACYTLVIGEVLAVYVADEFVREGRVDTAAMRPIARMGYMDYAVVTPEQTFTLNRPLASEDGRSVTLAQAWDGIYR